MAITAGGFVISLGYYTIAAAVCFILFAYFRDHKFVRKYYQAKCYLPKSIVKFPPPRLPKVLFGWIIPVLSYDQKQVLQYAGLDGLTMLRLLYLGFGYSLLATLFNCAVLIPVNITTGDQVDELIAADKGEPTYTSLDKLGMANMNSGSNVLFVHVAITYLLSFFMYSLLWRYHKDAVALRINYLANVEKGAETHTVLVRDIPAIAGGTPIERFSTSFLFFVPEKHRRSATLALAKCFGGSEGAGFFHTLGNKLFDCGLGILLFFHNCTKCCKKEPLPVTWRSDKTALPDVPPTQQSMSGEQGKSALLGLEECRDYVKGIPIATELSAWPGAERTVTAGASPQQMVECECGELYGEDFVTAEMVYDTISLDPKVAEYERRFQSMLDTVDGLAAKARKGKLVNKKGKMIKAPKTKVVGAKYGEWGMTNYGKGVKTVDALDFNIKRLDQLKKEIYEEQTKAKGKPAAAAFVSFRSRVSQTLASSAMWHHDTSAWTSTAAPAPADIVWENLKWRSWELTLRKALIGCATVALVLLYIIPVTFVQGIISSSNWLDFVKDIPALNAIYQAVIPQLALKIFLLLLPPMLTWMSWLEGRVARTDIQLGLEKKFFYFQYFAVYITTIIASSLLTQLAKIIDDLGSIVTILGTTVPQTGTFWTNFIMLEALFALPFGLLSIVGMIIYYIKEKIALAPRAKDRCWQEQYVMYGNNVGSTMLSFLVIVSYGPIFPLVSCFGLLWFFMAIVTWKYQLVYMKRPEVESGGQLWPQVYNQVLLATWTMQLLVTVVIAVKKNIAAAITMAVALVITPIFGYMANRRFKRPLAIQSVRGARDMDKQDAHSRNQDVEGGSATTSHYENPVFSFDEAQHQMIIAEVSRWKDIFEGSPWTPEEFALAADGDEAATIQLQSAVVHDSVSNTAKITEATGSPESYQDTMTS